MVGHRDRAVTASRRAVASGTAGRRPGARRQSIRARSSPRPFLGIEVCQLIVASSSAIREPFGCGTRGDGRPVVQGGSSTPVGDGLGLLAAAGGDRPGRDGPPGTPGHTSGADGRSAGRASWTASRRPRDRSLRHCATPDSIRSPRGRPQTGPARRHSRPATGDGECASRPERRSPLDNNSSAKPAMKPLDQVQDAGEGQWPEDGATRCDSGIANQRSDRFLITLPCRRRMRLSVA
jgi:hypothetical protein